MPTLEAVQTGNPCWIDVMTSDPAATSAFYTALFGWKADEPNPDFGGYFNFTKDGVRIAGGTPQGAPGIPDAWSTYLAVDDASATCAAIEAAGGTVMVPAMAVGDLGSMAVAVDPGGAVIGMWQPGEHKGFGIIGEPGAPAWFELHTSAYQPSLEFYRRAFDWDLHTVSDTPEFRYSTLHDGDDQAAGIMDSAADLPDGSPSHWTVYFAVADTDATLATVVELGGSIENPAQDTPYGRLAVATDTTGARFSLLGPNLEG